MSETLEKLKDFRVTVQRLELPAVAGDHHDFARNLTTQAQWLDESIPVDDQDKRSEIIESLAQAYQDPLQYQDDHRAIQDLLKWFNGMIFKTYEILVNEHEMDYRDKYISNTQNILTNIKNIFDELSSKLDRRFKKRLKEEAWRASEWINDKKSFSGFRISADDAYKNIMRTSPQAAISWIRYNPKLEIKGEIERGIEEIFYEEHALNRLIGSLPDRKDRFATERRKNFCHEIADLDSDTLNEKLKQVIHYFKALIIEAFLSFRQIKFPVQSDGQGLVAEKLKSIFANIDDFITRLSKTNLSRFMKNHINDELKEVFLIQVIDRRDKIKNQKISYRAALRQLARGQVKPYSR